VVNWLVVGNAILKSASPIITGKEPIIDPACQGRQYYNTTHFDADRCRGQPRAGSYAGGNRGRHSDSGRPDGPSSGYKCCWLCGDRRQRHSCDRRHGKALFAGVVPVNGFLVANNSSANLYVSDVGAASAGGGSIPIAPGAVFITPSGYKPAGVVSLFASSTGQSFAARRW
jgi:hypothetical protein